MPRKAKKDLKKALTRRLMEERKLVMKRLLLLRRAGVETLAVPEEEGRKGDLLDQAQASLRKEVESAIREQLLARAASLERAYRKLIAGTYGICEGCGQMISRSRLEAMPEAIYCTPCQEKKENTGRIIRATG
ncbi:MAG: TraR/DksA C4-type zinc finger protein [candidate division NC10 bacterium]|nr:TraR/DksA C4-type zinc finger protein [candidate division NC10 bacterium]